MPHAFACPICQAIQHIAHPQAGQVYRCTDCLSKFMLDLADLPSATSASGQADMPLASWLASQLAPQPEPDAAPADAVALSPGYAFARAHGLDLDAKLVTEVFDESDAERELEQLKEVLVEVPRAYTPSGRMAPDTAVQLGLGIVRGSAIMTLLVILSTAAVLSVLVILRFIVEILGFVGGCLLSLLGWPTILLLLISPPGLFGTIASELVNHLSHRARNRNLLAAGIAVSLMMTISIALGWVVFDWLARPMAVNQLNLESNRVRVWSLVLAGIWLVVAVLVGISGTNFFLRDTYFCEDCETFMHRARLRQTELGGVLAATTATAATAADPAALAAVLTDAPPGEVGKPELQTCPECGRAILDLNVSIQFTWQEGKTPRQTMWTCHPVSIELTAQQAQAFRGLIVEEEDWLKQLPTDSKQSDDPSITAPIPDRLP